jgi:cytochrome c oxidase subunit 2
MNKQEIVALCVVLFILILFPVGVFAYQRANLQASEGNSKVIDLVAQVPQAGGWKPQVITVNKGDTVQLRITGRDVVHGFAIGRLGVDVGRILPGETATVEFTADRLGRFTFYCNIWCSPFHYRMRGTLEVVDPLAPYELPVSEAAPADALQGLDIDAPHEVEHYPVVPSSAIRGKLIYERLVGSELPGPEELQSLREQSPSAVFVALSEARFPGAAQGLGQALTLEETWDVVAYLWSLTTTPQDLSLGEALYAKNCAACHGETGGGDGPGARYLERAPVDFTYAKTMAGGTHQIYEAKTRRGGMGTGMPNWGSIFSGQELRSVIDYLWTFLFSYSD